MAVWHRYYKIARKGTKTTNPYIEFDSKADFMEDMFPYADDVISGEYEKQGKEIDPDWYDIETQDLIDTWCNDAVTDADYWLEGQPFGITGGVTLGDYTYHIVSVEQDNPFLDDIVSIEMQDIGRRN